MADYVVGIGGSTSLMIRDTGGWVEFWVKTGPQTWNNDQQFSYFANGAFSGVFKFRMLRGGNWQHVRSVFVGYDQTVTWSIYNAGLGFPTYHFNQHIQRSTVPLPPTLFAVNTISSTQLQPVFGNGPDGGSPIVENQVGYGTSSNGPTAFVGSDGDDVIGGFYSGQRVYFWARARNALGWSGWSNRGEGTTWKVPTQSQPAAFYDIKQTVLGVKFFFDNGGTSILESQFQYGRDITGAAIDGTVTINEDVEYLSNLDPGKIYYFWGRARNSVGWGPWSSTASMVTLIAGARVLVGGQWKRAVPYVKAAGVWKVAEPWVKDAGIWKRTAQ